MPKNSEGFIEKMVRKVWKHTTDAKMKTLRDRAKNNPKLARQLDDLDKEFTDMKKNIAAMEDLLRDD